jgi:DnaJ-class molecular chaperone
MSDWATRKKERKEYYEEEVHGWKLGTCVACSGSGIYDNTGSPPCGACEGTGRTRYKPDAKSL